MLLVEIRVGGPTDPPLPEVRKLSQKAWSGGIEVRAVDTQLAVDPDFAAAAVHELYGKARQLGG